MSRVVGITAQPLPHKPCRRCRTTDWDAFGPRSSLTCADCLRVQHTRQQHRRDAATRLFMALGLPQCGRCTLIHESADNPDGLCGLCQRERDRVAA